MKVSAALAGAVCLFAAVSLSAGEVTLEKSHICCGGCVKGIEAALEKVEGVTEVSVDQDAKSVTFQATNAKVAKQGVRALARAGFAGEAKHEGKAVKLPAPKIEEGATAEKVRVTKMHLCCGACVKAVEGAVTKVDGVSKATCDRDKGSCTIEGENVSLTGVLQALRDAGFHGSIPMPKKDGEKGKKKKADS